LLPERRGALGRRRRFVVEAFVPDLARFDRDQRIETERVATDEVSLEVSRHHASEQRVESQRMIVREDGIRLYPVQIRYAFPAELDLMARLAGLQLAKRFGGGGLKPSRQEAECMCRCTSALNEPRTARLHVAAALPRATAAHASKQELDRDLPTQATLTRATRAPREQVKRGVPTPEPDWSLGSQSPP
jgi:hypothetical protein